MPVQKISEQQFRTRRKDRKMAWVDLFAFLIGLLVLSVSVAGIIVYEEPPEPFTWDYGFFEGKVSYKACVGKIGGQVGCSPLDTREQREGEENKLQANFDPLELANVTQVTFTLTWIDDVPDFDNPNSNEYQRAYVYDNNSTDILRLDIETPWGETATIEGANIAQKPYTGRLDLMFNISTMPEGGKVSAFTLQEGNQKVLDMGFTDTGHKAMGEWKAWITVVREGDLQGTLPTSACPEGVEIPEDVSNTTGEDCNLQEDQDQFEQTTLGAADAAGYQPSYDDKGQDWVLDMTIRTYQQIVTF